MSLEQQAGDAVADPPSDEPVIDGTCADAYDGVRQAFTENFANGLEVGASVCVMVDGEAVVDLWGGVTEAGGAPWQRDTVTNVWSTTKTMTALCALMLADQGVLDFDAPVHTYWPEFEQEGKSGVLVRHLMSHTAGLPGWEEPMTSEDLYDWDRACDLLARQRPMWEPGTAMGYHAVTQGFLVGEVVRRITGSSLGTFFREHVAEPLGADFTIGTPPETDARIARIVPPAAEDAPDLGDGLLARIISNPPLRGEVAWEEGWRRAEIPAANGHGNARSVARVQNVVACGGSAGDVTLLSPEGCERIFQEQFHGVDKVLGATLRHGIGYGLNSVDMPIGDNDRTCFWGGWGGSIIINDLDRRMTITYVMNRMAGGTLGDQRGGLIALAAYMAHMSS
jgi:CubicO group peptidase (beta-lactamase class C family)